MTKWIYINTEPGVWTVGFYSPAGEWITDSDQHSKECAALRVHWLNGTFNAPMMYDAILMVLAVAEEGGGMDKIEWQQLREAVACQARR